MQWIKWIMECITTISFSVNINGEKRGHFRPTRGIRQGDPLSPYLFLICVERFTSLLHRAKDKHQISGMKIAQKGPTLTHLFFANDSLIFCKVSVQEAKAVVQVIEDYGKASA